MTALYATFDPSALGPQLALERSNTVLVATAPADINRTALVYDGKDSDSWNAEFIVWGDADIDNRVAVGIVRPGASLSTYVGGDSDGYGYRLAEGQLHNAGASIQSVTAGRKGQIIGVLVDLIALTLNLELDGVPLATITLPDTGPWHLAASLGSGIGYDLQMMVNTGQRALEYGRYIRMGWFSQRESQGEWRFADRPWLSAPDDEIPNVRYRGLLMDRSRLSLRGGLSFWPMRSGASGVQSSSGTLSVGNADGSLDAMAAGDIRDAQVRILELPENGSYDDAVQIADMVVDSITAPDDMQIDIRVGDVLDQLDQALQDRLVPPDADESSADQVWPMSLGACRSVEPVLIKANPEDDPDAAARYALHDGPVLGLGYVRDGGYPFNYTAIPPDYWLDSLGRLMLAREPALALTADVSSVGGDVPGGPVDLLDGSGDFTDPLLWDLKDATVGGGNLTLTNTVPGPYTIDAWASPVGFVMEAGKTYRFNVEIAFLSGGLPTFGQFPAIVLTGSPDGVTPFRNRTSAYWERAFTGIYTAVISPPVTTRLFIAILATQNGVDVGRIRAVKAFEVKTDPVDDEALEPITLEAFLREIIEVRAGWSPDSWSSADAAAIDAATGYAGVGFHAREATTLRDALQGVLDAYCACLWRDDDGVIRVTRLIAPESVPHTRTITPIHMLSDLSMRHDLAPGLTTQAQCRKNWRPLTPGEITSDTIDVPASLRARLTADYRISVSYSGALATRYAHARNIDPQGLLLDKRPDGQGAIDHVGSMYSVTRDFYEARVVYGNYERGQVVRLIYPRYGLNDGKNVMIVDVDRDPIARTCILTMWG